MRSRESATTVQQIGAEDAELAENAVASRREAASMPIQKRLLELRLERSGALRESPSLEQPPRSRRRPPRHSAPVSSPRMRIRRSVS